MGDKINNYSSIDNNITEMQLTEDASFIGLHTVSLTNYKTTTAPTIAAGSYVEVGGALYGFSSAETITGSPSDGATYIIIIPAGATCTAQYTNTAPTWSDAKQGYYGTGGAATYRYLNYIMVKSGSNYTKYIKTYDDAIVLNSVNATTATITTGNIATGNITLAQGITAIYDSGEFNSITTNSIDIQDVMTIDGDRLLGGSISDTDPVFMKKFYAASVSDPENIAHGLTNPHTNNDILYISARKKGVSSTIFIDNSSISYNNTNIIITGQTGNIYVVVIYR
jgi:hypothetical protein